jgi:hypothetical protein
MADYNDTLNLYKQLQKNGAEHVDATFSTPTVGMSVEALDEAVYGAYDNSEDEQKNAGNKLLIDTMKEIESGNVSEATRERIEENIRNSKMPAAILQSMLDNPLINTKVGKDDVDEFVEKTLKSSAGLQKASKIVERVEREEKKKAEEKRAQQPLFNPGVGAQVDYEKMSEIVESIVSNKMTEFSRRLNLNERKENTPFNGIKVLQLKENGTFLMLDTDDNIYECKLTYKGKNKRKH